MIYRAFSLFDLKADLYMPPFYAGQLGQAVRSVIEAAADTRTTLGRYPQDFSLMELGEFDDVTGQLTPGRIHNHGLVSQLLAAAVREHRSANPELPLGTETPA